jgi:hypothetical protein
MPTWSVLREIFFFLKVFLFSHCSTFFNILLQSQVFLRRTARFLWFFAFIFKEEILEFVERRLASNVIAFGGVLCLAAFSNELKKDTEFNISLHLELLRHIIHCSLYADLLFSLIDDKVIGSFGIDKLSDVKRDNSKQFLIPIAIDE